MLACCFDLVKCKELLNSREDLARIHSVCRGWEAGREGGGIGVSPLIYSLLLRGRRCSWQPAAGNARVSCNVVPLLAFCGHYTQLHSNLCVKGNNSNEQQQRATATGTIATTTSNINISYRRSYKLMACAWADQNVH